MRTTPHMTLAGWFRDRATLTPERRALTFEGDTWDYRTMQERFEVAAAALRDGGVRHGDRVGFIGLNHPAYFETLFAASRLGAIFVPLNYRLTGPELTFVINDAGVHTIVADALHRPVIDSLRDSLPCRRYLTSEEPGEGGGAEGWTTLAAAAVGVEPLAEEEADDPDEVALIMYTSGTTGRPKGAMLTHANIFWADIASLLHVDTVESDVSLVCAPLFHIGGLNVTTLVTWMKGGELVLHRNFDTGRFLSDIARYGVTTVFAVPAMLFFASLHPDFAASDLTSLRFMVCAGAPVPEGLVKLFNGRGVPINQAYGLTETAPAGTCLTQEWCLAKLGSAGRVPMMLDVKLVDSNGATVTEPLARGELCVRGPNVMKGYWNRPEETREAIDPDGWLHTGDVAYVDEDGFFYIADRIKDMVISGGVNIYPVEVEGVLLEHPAVADVAVIGLPNERWGEIVAAVVVLNPDATLTLRDLRRFAGERLAKYKLPRRLEFVAALPRNPALKVLKFELRELFGGDPTERGVDTER